MTNKKRVLPALIFSLFAAAAAPSASAQQFSNVVVFGDSLSDAGYFRPFLAGLGLPPSLVATLGRFTTNPGPVWSELVSTHYGVSSPAPSNAGGSIYAQGGARVALPSASTPPGFAQRPVSTQIDEYLAAHNGVADPNALYTVWAGANDFLQNFTLLNAGQITPAQLQTNVLGAVTATAQQVARLYQAGARNVMVFLNYDPALTPAFAALDPVSRAGATQLAVGANTTFVTTAAAMGLRVIPVDVFSLMNEVRANSAAFGFTNVTGMACGAFPPITTATTVSSQFCYPGNLVAPNAAQTYMFADSIHPTTGTHAIIAAFAESLIDGPAAYSLLAETPLRTRQAHVRTLNDGMFQGRSLEVSRWSVFAAYDRGKFDVDSTAFSGLKSTNDSVSVGLSGHITEPVVVGIAVGKTKSDGTFGNDMGSFTTKEIAYSVFGSMLWNGFYGTGILSIANIDFDNVQRNIFLGPAVRTSTANPGGANASAFFEAGYDFPVGAFKIGPTVSVTLQDVDVNAFDESAAAGSAALHIGAQKRKSEVWSGGIRASATFQGWTPWLRVTADKERRDDVRFVTASPLSLGGVSSYDIQAYAPDTTFTTIAVGVHGTIAERIGVALSYYNVSGRSGIKEDGVSGMLSYRF